MNCLLSRRSFPLVTAYKHAVNLKPRHRKSFIIFTATMSTSENPLSAGLNAVPNGNVGPKYADVSSSSPFSNYAIPLTL